MNRKLVLALVVLLVLSVAAVYILIPRTLVVSTAEIIKCNANGAGRLLPKDVVWENIAPGGRVDDLELRVQAAGFHEVAVLLGRGADTVSSRLTLLSLGNVDSIGMRWQCIVDAGAGPWERVRKYRQAVGIRRMMDTVLGRMRAWLEKSEHIYGIRIVDSMSKTSSILIIRRFTPEYPGTADIYQRVGRLRKYIADSGAKEIDYPMLHVSEKTAEGYESIVGVPVDRVVQGAGEIEPKRYVPWKIMTGKVVGGPFMAEQAMGYLQQYVTDHQKPAMGVPFQSLVTERNQEPDTSRWVTWVVQAVP